MCKRQETCRCDDESQYILFQQSPGMSHVTTIAKGTWAEVQGWLDTHYYGADVSHYYAHKLGERVSVVTKRGRKEFLLNKGQN